MAVGLGYELVLRRMEWEYAEKETLLLEERELGELYIAVEAKNIGDQIYSQIELVNQKKVPGKEGLILSRVMKYDKEKIIITGMLNEETRVNLEQIAGWITKAALASWRGRISHSKMAALYEEEGYGRGLPGNGRMHGRLAGRFRKDAVKVRHGGDCALIGASTSAGAPFRTKLRTLM